MPPSPSNITGESPHPLLILQGNPRSLCLVLGSVLGSWGKTTRDAVRDKERCKRRRTPTLYPSTAFRGLARRPRPLSAAAPAREAFHANLAAAAHILPFPDRHFAIYPSAQVALCASAYPGEPGNTAAGKLRLWGACGREIGVECADADRRGAPPTKNRSAQQFHIKEPVEKARSRFAAAAAVGEPPS